MSKTDAFADLTPEEFLQTFINEASRIAPFASCSSLQSFIQQIVFKSSACWEEKYRAVEALTGPLTPDCYAELIVLLKNSIGGRFQVVSSNRRQVQIHAERCPFGSLVHSAPGLCHMTSSIFGGVAARNFGYAKVELQRRIALGSDSCDICIHLDPASAVSVLGDEYFSDGQQVIAEVRAPDELQRIIEERLHALWTDDAGRHEPVSVSERPRLVAESASMRVLLQAVEKIADTRATVLLLGETGVGKEVLAKSIHGMSSRLQMPFVAVNCGSLPAELVESELFGHEQGAFTDAKHQRQGRFELADGGTLFLDEVDSLSPKAQVSLLRVLQEGRFERVGGHRSVACDVRVIAASNRDLSQLVEQGEFRRDLFFRINVVPLHIMPLRERREDIAPLVKMLLVRFSERYQSPVKEVSPEAMRILEGHHWPGNIRELENVLERTFLFADGHVIRHINLDLVPQTSREVGTSIDLRELKKKAADEVERRILHEHLDRNNGDVGAVADALGMTPRAVYQKLNYHGFDNGRKAKVDA
ncbi:sigma 54-interacting transcriptional regulator [Sedimenticola hydrogenitrophicus]|uniref:sigma 54-interacting transcriptional regulator n=1 Tax=Sedimenticola hydrogenitrophicus TaxID=2967975 RepID=UPI0023AFA99E|nr:sigma 54-interacting transcriptional regulator [Sedimenticola hydrogenitrophicus]